jgi:hypothetical protein
MQNPQALARSVFGTIAAFQLLPLLAQVEAEGGHPAFGLDLSHTSLCLEAGLDPGRAPANIRGRLT